MSRRPPFEPIGFANLLQAAGDFRIANDQLYKWSGAYWLPLAARDAERLALDWIESGDRGIANSTNAKQACATAMLRLPELIEPVRAPVVPVLNGYVHIDRDGVTLKPHDREMGLRHIIRCEYTPAAAAPMAFNRFVAQVLPDAEVRARVQEYIGYTLLPDAPHQIAQLWLGSGANGKGVLANIVQALHHRVAAINLDNMAGFNMTEVVTASLVYCDEVPHRRIDEAIFKMATAAETVQINRRYRDPISVNILAKWLLLGNHVPDVSESSEAFWRRVDLVPFNVVIPPDERDPLLARHIISHELSGVLNWALDGAVRLLARGRFDPGVPAAMREAKDAAKSESNSVLEWWRDGEYRLKPAADTLKASVYAAYASWCKVNGIASLPMPRFWTRLRGSVKGVVEGRLTTGAGRTRVCNVALQQSY